MLCAVAADRIPSQRHIGQLSLALPVVDKNQTNKPIMNADFCGLIARCFLVVAGGLRDIKDLKDERDIKGGSNSEWFVFIESYFDSLIKK